jgi:hypothetical protein
MGEGENETTIIIRPPLPPFLWERGVRASQPKKAILAITSIDIFDISVRIIVIIGPGWI